MSEIEENDIIDDISDHFGNSEIIILNNCHSDTINSYSSYSSYFDPITSFINTVITFPYSIFSARSMDIYDHTIKKYIDNKT